MKIITEAFSQLQKIFTFGFNFSVIRWFRPQESSAFSLMVLKPGSMNTTLEGESKKLKYNSDQFEMDAMPLLVCYK